MMSVPASTTVPPVNEAATVSTSVPAPRLTSCAEPVRTVVSMMVCPAGTVMLVSSVQVAVAFCVSVCPAASTTPAPAAVNDSV